MNMSYCRFRNTLQDLRDCIATLAEADETGEALNLSYEEKSAATQLVEEMANFTNDFIGDAGAYEAEGLINRLDKGGEEQ